MPYLSKEDQDRIAMALMEYKRSIDLTNPNNKIELRDTDELAERLGLNEKFYRKGTVD